MESKLLLLECPSGAFLKSPTGEGIVYGNKKWKSERHWAKWLGDDSVRESLCDIHPDRVTLSAATKDNGYRIRKNNNHDFLWSVSTILVNHRVVTAFQKAGITGVRFDPVHVEDSDGERPEYSLLTTSAGVQLSERAGIQIYFRCPRCQLTAYTSYKNLALDESTWDGSDICTPVTHSQYVYASPKVLALFEREKFTNSCLMDPEHYTWGDYLARPEDGLSEKERQQMLEWWGKERLPINSKFE
jgi:hypothetical protein